MGSAESQHRLASRHFRNQLLLLKAGGNWPDFVGFVGRWTDGLQLEHPEVRELDKETSIDVYLTEGRGPKGVAWVGDRPR